MDCKIKKLIYKLKIRFLLSRIIIMYRDLKKNTYFQILQTIYIHYLLEFKFH